MSKTTLDKLIGVLVAAAAAAQAILVSQGVETADLAAQITTGLAAVLAAYHGGSAVTAATSTSLDVHAAQAIAVTTPPVDSGDPALPVAGG